MLARRVFAVALSTGLFAIGCSTGPSDAADAPASGSSELGAPAMPCPQGGCPTFCAIATFSGPSYYAHNFATYAQAKVWLASLDAKESRIETGACAQPVACPMVYVPVCGVVTGGGPTTYGNTCELLAATRKAAGSAPPGEAKGELLHAGACETPPPPPKPCDGKKCGDECPSMFGSPVQTYCNAAGECLPGKPVCEPTYDCDLSHVKCDAAVPGCKPGTTPSVNGVCYGACVPSTSCGCEPGNPSQCPEGYVCWASTKHCGPYVK